MPLRSNQVGNRQAAVDFLNQGNVAAQDKTQPVHLQHAYQLFSSSVFVDQTFGEGWYALGNANSDLGMQQAAVAAWRRGLRCELTNDLRAKMLSNLGWRIHTLGDQQEAAEHLQAALQIDHKLMHAWLNMGLVHGINGERLAAVECMREALRLEPDDVTARMGLAFSLLHNEQYREGFDEFEIRFKYRLHQFLQYPYPKWHGERDQTIMLVADQGLGDTLSFARFVPLAARRAKYIHMVVQSELMRGFAQAFCDIPNLNIMPLASPFLPADAWSTFVSLPFALGLSDQEVRETPQIKLPVYSMPTSWMAPDARFHIGIAYAGSPLNEIDKFRNIPVTEFLELYRVPGIQLYSLQVGERAKDLQDTGIIGLVRDLSPYIRDVTDTVSILRDLDLVICCESALGHICAAAGQECWIPYSYMGKDYRLGPSGEVRLWTPRHRVFPQGPDQQWAPVFSQMVDALQEKTHGLSRAA